MKRLLENWMHLMRPIAWIGLLLWGCCGAIGLTYAAQSYPERPITLVIPFGAQSVTDYFGRNLSRHIGKYLNNATLAIENMPGASGTKAAMAVRSAPPDGYTLLVGRVATQAIAPALDPSLPYRWNDFSFLGVLEIDPLICAVRTDFPVLNARDLLVAIRKSPGTLKYSTAGPGTIHNLAVIYMLKLAGLKPGAAIGVSFSDGKGAIDALIDGQTDFACANAGTLLAAVKSARLRPLFTTAPGRMVELPQLQNASEAGMRDLGKLLGWTVLLGPRGMSEQRVADWKRALQQLAKDPAWRAGTLARGGIPALGTSKDREGFIKEQYEFYDRLISGLGIRQGQTLPANQ